MASNRNSNTPPVVRTMRVRSVEGKCLGDGHGRPPLVFGPEGSALPPTTFRMIA